MCHGNGKLGYDPVIGFQIDKTTQKIIFLTIKGLLKKSFYEKFIKKSAQCAAEVKKQTKCYDQSRKEYKIEQKTSLWYDMNLYSSCKQ